MRPRLTASPVRPRALNDEASFVFLAAWARRYTVLRRRWKREERKYTSDCGSGWVS